MQARVNRRRIAPTKPKITVTKIVVLVWLDSRLSIEAISADSERINCASKDLQSRNWAASRRCRSPVLTAYRLVGMFPVNLQPFSLPRE